MKTSKPATLDFPLHFRPYLKPVIWGGNRIASYKGVVSDLRNIGESWEISAVPGHVSVVDRGSLKGMSLNDLMEEYGRDLVGTRVFERFGKLFPLLIKFLDAAEDLSVQVHPDDEMAGRRHNCQGKTEMWRVIEARPDAKLYVGFKDKLNPEEYAMRVATNTIMDAVCSYDSKPGDAFFLPAGCIHAIGGGNLLAEIQQTSDISYRVYDYDRRDHDGNPRQLHLEEASEAMDFGVGVEYKIPEGNLLLADCSHFVVREWRLTDEEIQLSRDRDSFAVVMCMKGSVKVRYALSPEAPHHSLTINSGDTWLFPSTLRSIYASGPAEILVVRS